MSSSSALHHLVPKLTGTNYATWKTKMEMVLIRDDLWPIVCEERLRPAVLSESTSSSRTRANTTSPANDTETAALKWDADARKATANIFLCLDEKSERLVNNIRNPVELWKKLQKIYEQKGFSSRFYLRKKFFALQLADYLKPNEDNAMTLYLDAHRSLCQQLRSAGAAIDNETEASVLLGGLGDSYESFVVATTQSFRQNTEDDEIDVERLISQLLDEDRRRKGVRAEPAEIGDANSGSALYSNRKRQWQSQRSQSESNKRPLTCNHCERPGHKQNDCWLLHPEKKVERNYGGQKRQKLGNANLATAGDCDPF